jgi:putative transposase
MSEIIIEYPEFFTATNHNWEMILRKNQYKDIIMNSLKFLVEEKRIKLFAFVLMDNHIHLIWQMLARHLRMNVKRDFLSYTAKKIKTDLLLNQPHELNNFLVNAKDRNHNFWKRNSLSIELRTQRVFNQKLDYIHWNPVKAGLCKLPEEYYYSSALFYDTGIDNWGFLTHANE